jgi:hypothetical protein
VSFRAPLVGQARAFLKPLGNDAEDDKNTMLKGKGAIKPARRSPMGECERHEQQLGAGFHLGLSLFSSCYAGELSSCYAAELYLPDRLELAGSLRSVDEMRQNGRGFVKMDSSAGLPPQSLLSFPG